ncbi:tryptophan-rich sensory protein TspO [Thioclava sp. FR2]|uniref:tryptophan-rich sensory protein TspO n=1 Tax=Thioclava sp. FR2 TaxID=3445780 RepID=UPI003EB78998
MDWTVFFVFLLACGAAASTGVLFPPGDWYRKLEKPRWTPPNRAFPIVWTALYLAMAIAAARISTLSGTEPSAGLGLALWAAQIALNTLWTPVFFRLRRMKAGLAIISMLWLAVAAMTVVFWGLDPLAGLLVLPYLLWVTVAAALNATILSLNKGRA